MNMPSGPFDLQTSTLQVTVQTTDDQGTVVWETGRETSLPQQVLLGV